MSEADNIRFSFRSNEHDVEVVIQGPSSWVDLYRERIGLDGDIGYTQSVRDASDDIQGDDAKNEKVQVLPGPPPDPSRLPSVVRVVGDLDIEAGLESLGAPSRSEPDLAEISLFLDELEEAPEPLSDNISGDPMAESWLQLLLTLVVREHGHSSLPVGTIELLVGERMNREGIDLEIFLDRLWLMGRLEKVYGSEEVSYSPNPSWLEMR